MRVEWGRLVPELTVADLASSLSFYVAGAGFRVVHRRADPPFAYLDLDGAQVMLEQEHAGGWEAEPAAGPRGRGVNFQIEVSDLAGVLARLAAAGHPLFRPAAEAWYAGDGVEHGQVEALVRDPDGYLLRFSQPLGERAANDAEPVAATDAAPRAGPRC